MKNTEAAISSQRGRDKRFEDWGGEGGVKNFRTGGVTHLLGLLLLGGGGQYHITCHVLDKKYFYWRIFDGLI